MVRRVWILPTFGPHVASVHTRVVEEDGGRVRIIVNDNAIVAELDARDCRDFAKWLAAVDR